MLLTQAVQTEMSTLYASNEYATQLNAITKAFTAAAKDGNQYMNTNKKTAESLQTDIMLLLIFQEVPFSLAKNGAHFLRLQTGVPTCSVGGL